MERDNRLSFQMLSREDITAEASPIRLRSLYLGDTDHQMTENFPGTWSRTQGLRSSRWRVSCRAEGRNRGSGSWSLATRSEAYL